jgi:hypothetical protein
MKSGCGEWRCIFIVLDTQIYLFLDDRLLLYVKLAQLSSVEKFNYDRLSLQLLHP